MPSMIQKGALRVRSSNRFMHLKCWPYANHAVSEDDFDGAESLSENSINELKSQIKEWNEKYINEKNRKLDECKIGREVVRQRRSIQDHPALKPNQKFNLLSQFPQEILLKIFLHLPGIDVLALATTCQQWYKLSQSDVLWEEISQDEIPAASIIWSKMKREGLEEISWRNVYNRVFFSNSKCDACFVCGNEVAPFNPCGYKVCLPCSKDTKYEIVPESKLKKYGAKAEQLRKEHGLRFVNEGYSSFCGFKACYTKYEDFYPLCQVLEIQEEESKSNPKKRKGKTSTAPRKRKR